MVDDRPEDTTPSPDLRRPKRAPPTIELEATEVKSAAEAGAAADSSSAEASSAETSGAEASGSAAAVPSDQAGKDFSAAAAVPDAEPDVITPEPSPRPRRTSTVLIAAGSGAVAAALLIALAGWAGWPARPRPQPATPAVGAVQFEALAARVAAVESRPAASPTPTPAPTVVQAPPDPALAGRLDALETAVTALRGDLAAMRGQSDAAAAALTDLKAAPREVAAPVAPVDLAPITDRLAQVERAAGTLKTEAAQQSAKPSDDKPLRRIVAASLLDGSVRQSEPYAAALDQARPLAPDPNALKPLEPFAASGVPNAATLCRELLALLPQFATAPDAATTGTGLVDRLQAGAVRLLRIQRTDAVAGDDRGAVVSRITAAALRNDIAGARRELNALQGADRAGVQPWIDKADARDAALAASRQFAADAMASLTKPGL